MPTRIRSETRAATLLAALLVASCVGPEGSHSSAEGGTPRPRPSRRDAARPWDVPDAAPPTYAPTFVAVFDEILVPTCSPCHGDAYFTLVDPVRAYASLLGVPASSYACADGGVVRVVPGHAEESLLYLKVTTPPCGGRMPLRPGGGLPLPARQVEQIRRWIALGAPYDTLPEASVDASVDASMEAGADARPRAARDASEDGGAPRGDAATDASHD